MWSDQNDDAIRHAHLRHAGTIVSDGLLSPSDPGDGIISFDDTYPYPVPAIAFDSLPVVWTPGTAGATGSTAINVSASANAGIVAPGSGAATPVAQNLSSGPSSGLVIIANYDTSIADLGTTSAQYTDITNAISAAVQFYEHEITNPITITIDFGFGEVDGTSLDSGDLGESLENDIFVSYTQLSTALLAHGDPSIDVPSDSPVKFGFWEITDAEAAALNLSGNTSGQIDGYVGLSSTFPMTYDPANRAVSGDYDAIGVLEHEISEVMGRFESLGTYGGTDEYAPLDLFRYSSAGTRDLTPGPGYFSIDGGTTNLDTFNDPTGGGDAGDWSSVVEDDSYDAFSSIGVANTVSATDLIVMNELGYSLACYVEGTRILSARGDINIDDLRAGDLVHARFGGLTPIRWIGQRSIDCTRHRAPENVWPIRVARNAFAPGVPCRDLFLSPDHAVRIEESLIPIRLLVNGTTIRQDIGRPRVRYFHIELARHDIITADGLEAESYLDTGNRGMFENAGVPLVLHPTGDDSAGQERREAGSCLPLRVAPEQIEPVWRRLQDRAKALGFVLKAVPTTDDPSLTIAFGAHILRPLAREQGRYMFLIPPGFVGLRLHSNRAIPSAARPWIDDRRWLGVMVQKITIRRGEEETAIAMDDPALIDGWWAAERDDRSIWRWTNGDAALPAIDGPAIDGPAIIEVWTGDRLTYPLETAALAA